MIPDPPRASAAIHVTAWSPRPVVLGSSLLLPVFFAGFCSVQLSTPGSVSSSPLSLGCNGQIRDALGATNQLCPQRALPRVVCPVSLLLWCFVQQWSLGHFGKQSS